MHAYLNCGCFVSDVCTNGTGRLAFLMESYCYVKCDKLTWFNARGNCLKNSGELAFFIDIAFLDGIVDSAGSWVGDTTQPVKLAKCRLAIEIVFAYLWQSFMLRYVAVSEENYIFTDTIVIAYPTFSDFLTYHGRTYIPILPRIFHQISEVLTDTNKFIDPYNCYL